MISIADENHRWWILGATSLILGVTVLDETIVGVALPRIRQDLQLSEPSSHWIVNAYLLTFTCFVALGGRLGDTFGTYRLFMVGTALFGVTSLLCAVAPSGAFLITGRALQGLSTALIFPTSLAMLTSAFPVAQRGTAFGIQITGAALFMSSGPLLGGILTETLSWRWIFWINIPLAATIALLAWLARAAPSSSQSREHASDGQFPEILGPAVLVIGILSFVSALMQGNEWGWGEPVTLLLIAFGVFCLIAFVIIEISKSEPTIEIKLFKIREFSGSDLVFFTFQFSKVVTFIFVADYLQKIAKMTPIQSGGLVALAVLPTLVTSFLAGKATDKIGPRMPMMLGLLVNGLSLICVGFAMHYDITGLLMGALICWGCALPFVAVSARRTLMSAVPMEQRGQAGGLNLTIQMLGGTLGLAITSAILGATGSYSIAFVLTGFLALATIAIVHYLVE